eukprot:TRINITY_DN7376_c0_g1_i1.p1 TRINITY_DN7376_c0_g1~~TRINITY_DN7376_c0_g1_i1.p1  ORF type:complete len:480 (+),score=45.13 TRINITY_DN7376_c0_g1_i1:251-1690(+)
MQYQEQRMIGLHQSLTLSIFLVTLFYQGLSVSACSCEDKQVPDGFSCKQQAKWGKCDEDWIINSGYCKQSCGRCECNNIQEQSNIPKTLSCSQNCVDKPPPGSEFECPDMAKWNKCNEDWIHGYCKKSCNICTSCPQNDNKQQQQQQVPKCSNNCDDKAPFNSEFECPQMAKWGKCKEDWMTGYCRLSCNKCTKCPQNFKQDSTLKSASKSEVVQERKANTAEQLPQISEAAVIETTATKVRQTFPAETFAQDYAPSAPYIGKAVDSGSQANLGVGGFEIILERASSDSQATIERQFLLDEIPDSGCTPLDFQLSKMPNLSLFITMLYRSGLMQRLTSGQQDLTLFVPTNYAVDTFYMNKNLNPDLKNLQSTTTLDLLKYHVVGYPILHQDFIKYRTNKAKTWLKGEQVVLQTVTQYVPNNFLCRGKYCDDNGNKVSTVNVMDARENKVAVVGSLFKICRVTVHIVDSVLLPNNIQISI